MNTFFEKTTNFHRQKHIQQHPTHRDWRKRGYIKTGSGRQAFSTSSTSPLIPTEPESNHIAIYPLHTAPSNNTHSSPPLFSLPTRSSQ